MIQQEPREKETCKLGTVEGKTRKGLPIPARCAVLRLCLVAIVWAGHDPKSLLYSYLISLNSIAKSSNYR
jgi:hypothetical protein